MQNFTNVIYHSNKTLTKHNPLSKFLDGHEIPIQGSQQTFILLPPEEATNLKKYVSKQPKITFIQFLGENPGKHYIKTEVDLFFMAKTALLQSTIQHNCDVVLNAFNILQSESASQISSELSLFEEDITECILFSDYAALNLRAGNKKQNFNPNSLGTLGLKTRIYEKLVPHVLWFCDDNQLSALEEFRDSLVSVRDDSIFTGMITLNKRDEINIKGILQIQ
ncbi:uncharacterized protein TRIADDRAFT_62880 [Trichoplax adhaerens]|uniref:Uncharacterized protein n=1 Tax=Trichoplax adhaerens TaxID=10228 RepID=B3SF68_TRIAD|nr:predicted protein [Trichoplax adhaerens]EDV18625.1 predicted protein [Trichoplax adhaerens]|eukprot:XP_002118887.1 predicted protein [Trichoplax adhaerens]